MESIRSAAWVGTWALVWGPIRELCEEFKTVDITAVSTDNFTQLSIFTELQDAHASLLTRHAYVEGTYEEYDRKVYDFCKEGLAHFRFHRTSTGQTCPSASQHPPPASEVRFKQ